MTGTSMDGLDIVCCDFKVEGENYDFEVVAAEQIAFGEKWYARLVKLIEQSAEVYAKTDVYFGHWLGQQCKAFIEKNQLQPDFVASHGQTIFHQPDKNFTGQIGDGESLVSYLPCPLVSNFRNKDVALGGQGAPLVPLGEKYLFPQGQIFLNLGGFCNIALGELAFDISSCNGILNLLVQQIDPSLEYDEGGQIARAGEFQEDFLQALNALPFYQEKPPKSLGWEWVQTDLIPLVSTFNQYPIADLMHTLCVHMAEQIERAVLELNGQGKKLLATGGGRHNTFLMELIQEKLSKHEVQLDEETSTEIVDYKEAIVFAFLGLRVLTGKSSVLHSVTGANLSGLCGSIHLPAFGGENYALL